MVRRPTASAASIRIRSSEQVRREKKAQARRGLSPQLLTQDRFERAILPHGDGVVLQRQLHFDAQLARQLAKLVAGNELLRDAVRFVDAAERQQAMPQAEAHLAAVAVDLQLDRGEPRPPDAANALGLVEILQPAVKRFEVSGGHGIEIATALFSQRGIDLP